MKVAKEDEEEEEEEEYRVYYIRKMKFVVAISYFWDKVFVVKREYYKWSMSIFCLI